MMRAGLPAAALLYLATSGFAAATEHPPHALRMLDTAQWQVTSSTTRPDADDAGWEAVQLPDTSATRRHEGSHFGNRPHGVNEAPVHWYRFNLDVVSADTPLAIYAPRLSDRFRVAVNGHAIYRSFTDGEVIDHAWNTPLFLRIPAVMLRRGRNEILFALDSPFTGSIYMSRLRVGSEAAIAPLYDTSRRLRLTAAEASAWMLAGLGLFGLLVWLTRREDKLHLLLGLGASAYALRMLHYFITRPFVSPEFFWWLATASLTWAMLFLFLFAFRYYAIHRPWLERTLTGATLIVSIVFFPGIGLDAYEHASLIYLLLIPLAASTALLLFQRAWQLRGMPQLLLATGFAANIAASVHDLGVMTGFISVENAYLMPLGAVVLFVCFTLALGARYVRSLNEVELLNRTLETRVAQRQAALSESYAKVQQLHAEQARSEERQRLMREIHDGIGANLAASLAAVEHNEQDPTLTARTLRQSIADLKLTIDSLEPVDGDVLSLLGNLRYRLAPQLEQAGIAIVWDVRPVPALDWLQPPHALHVLRIAQEAFSNILQHAQAQTVTVTTETRTPSATDTCANTSTGAADHDAEWIGIAIIDDGIGISPESPSSGGKGLGNMRHRASALNGRLDVQRGASGGTELRLWLPVQQRLTTPTAAPQNHASKG